MEEIESLEQTLIQHLRTSGLRPAKEVSLVDEVLELRRRRRQLVSALEAQLRTERERDSERVRLAEQAQTAAELELQRAKTHFQGELQAVERAWAEREHLQQSEEELRTESLRREWGGKFDSLRAAYEKEQRLLADKLEMLVREREQQEKRLSESLSLSLREKLGKEFQEKLQVAVQEHKSTLAAVSLREQDAVEERDKCRSLLGTMKQDYGKLTNTLIAMQKKMDESNRREKLLELRVVKLQRDNEELHAENERLAQKTQQQHADFEREREAQREKESALLSSIDEKMRRILEGKKKEIALLQEELVKERAKYAELSQMLQDIARS